MSISWTGHGSAVLVKCGKNKSGQSRVLLGWPRVDRKSQDRGENCWAGQGSAGLVKGGQYKSGMSRVRLG